MKTAWLVSLFAIACGGGGGSAPRGSAPPGDPPGSGSAVAPRAPSTVKRIVVTAGRPSGTHVTTTAPDGALTVQLAVLENGRGPRVEASLRIAADGTIAQLRATGRHTFGAKVDETFVREGATVRWTGEEERGERTLTAPAFFVPIAPCPEVDGLLARALIAAGGTLALLPGGTATLEKIGELVIKAGAESRKVTGYAIHGVGFVPQYTWLNADGTWFGTASVWSSVVPEGWEPVIEALLAKQEEHTRGRERAVAEANAHRPPAAGLAYTNARVLDVERGRWLPQHTVVVVGDTIRAVGPTGRVAVPAGAEVVDLGGRALVPGLVDMHAHLTAPDGVLNIASGVTTVRDVGNDPDKLDDFKRRYDDGTAIGPHVVRFGFIEGRNEKAASSKVTAETVDEANAGVDFFVKRGYEGIKIYNSVKPELVPVIAARAHAAKLQVTGHVPVHMLAHEAVKAGYDGIEHVNMLFLNFFATHETDTRDTTRFTLVGERAPDFDLGSPPARAFYELLRSRRTVIDPTLAAFEDLFVGEQGKITPGLEDLVARLPIAVQRQFLLGGLPVTSPEQRARYRATYAKLLAMVKRLHDEKIHVVLGTDHIGGLMLHQEMALFARAGLPPATILQLATIGSARAMKVDHVVGTIAPGRRADLAVIDGDPLADIRAIRFVVSAMRGGVVYPSAPLLESVGVRPAAAPAAAR